MKRMGVTNHKKTIALNVLLVILFIVCMPLTAFAQGTTLTITVPSQFSFTIEIEGEGRVDADGVSYTDDAKTILVNRNTKIVFIITPNTDYEINDVVYNNESVLDELQNNTFTLHKIESDSVLKVAFVPVAYEPISDNPQTGDNSLPIWIYFVLMIISFIALILIVKKDYIVK